ncbi:hypothetical protein WJX72_007189 [[Myrmecia] bisecta]|uniref:Uncharacterized protein n=1 Tax=[Myrmecia] bisecta TaxID=41462 RepID=A0AAW1P853_9CHLO
MLSALGLLAEADRLANGTPASTSQNIDLVGHPIAGWSSAGSSAASSAERPGARPVSAEDDISTESAAIIASARVHRTLFPSPHAQSMDSAEQPGATSISDMLAPRGSRSASPAAAEHVSSEAAAISAKGA